MHNSGLYLKAMKQRAALLKSVTVVDLFCGIGSLTHGLALEGFTVTAGIDNDPGCRYAYESNNAAQFVRTDVSRLTARRLRGLFRDAKTKVLVGCAPCQPFSSIRSRSNRLTPPKHELKPLLRFLRLVTDTKPDVVSMENVPGLLHGKKRPVFEEFVAGLKASGYHVSYGIVDAAEYGLPQHRKRLVLFASRFGKIGIIPATHHSESFVTVADAIRDLRPIKSGESAGGDPLHRSSKLSALNERRILATPRNGGSPKHWPTSLYPKCYRRPSGKSYMASVYGRMRWDRPGPTMTTHCTTLGTGRFGHPSQHRAISLREAARLQSFPDDYVFGEPGELATRTVARQIGNAVPITLARVIGRSIRYHLRNQTNRRNRKKIVTDGTEQSSPFGGF